MDMYSQRAVQGERGHRAVHGEVTYSERNNSSLSQHPPTRSIHHQYGQYTYQCPYHCYWPSVRVKMIICTIIHTVHRHGYYTSASLHSRLPTLAPPYTQASTVSEIINTDVDDLWQYAFPYSSPTHALVSKAPWVSTQAESMLMKLVIITIKRTVFPQN